VPLLDNVLAMAEAGCVTGGVRTSLGLRMRLKYGLAPQLEGRPHQALLCDPQTSGGLLIACAHDVVPMS